MDGSTSSYAAELGLVGVRERALAVGQAARTDGADVDDLVKLSGDDTNAKPRLIWHACFVFGAGGPDLQKTGPWSVR